MPTNIKFTEPKLIKGDSAQSTDKIEQFLASTSQLQSKDKDNITLRGNLEVLEHVLVDIVSELKYHKQQVSIISAEKDTSGAII